MSSESPAQHSEASSDVSLPISRKRSRNALTAESEPSEVIVELCRLFYEQGMGLTGTGGSMSIRRGPIVYLAPSGVQKELLREEDLYIMDAATGAILRTPPPHKTISPDGVVSEVKIKPSACMPLFYHAYKLRGSGACIHTHSINAMMVTMLYDKEFTMTHQEMIKGIAGHGFHSTITVPIIDNMSSEGDLTETMEEAIRKYPQTQCVLVRRHGVFVWGKDWIEAKVQTECYEYLFEAAVRMRQIGLSPAEPQACCKHKEESK